MAKRPKAKKQCATCSCNCIYFPQEPIQIQEETSINGIRHRKVVRKCLYDMSVINSWNKPCGRPAGPCLPKPYLPMTKRKPSSKKNTHSGGTLL